VELGYDMYALAIGAGFLAGLINTLAGSGSLVALSALVAMGLPADVANGTNRVGVLIQSVVAVVTMRAHTDDEDRPEGNRWIIGTALLGAIVGAVLAAMTDPEALEWIIVVVLWATLLVVLFKPGEWLRNESDEERAEPTPGKYVIFFVVGAWGGFLQAGVGILLLAALVLAAGKDVIEATAIKLSIVLVYTAVVLIVFVAYGQVHWGLGLAMGMGQAGGAWGGARFAATSPNAPTWIRRLLVVVIATAALELMGVFSLVTALL